MMFILIIYKTECSKSSFNSSIFSGDFKFNSCCQSIKQDLIFNVVAWDFILNGNVSCTTFLERDRHFCLSRTPFYLNAECRSSNDSIRIRSLDNNKLVLFLCTLIVSLTSYLSPSNPLSRNFGTKLRNPYSRLQWICFDN